jgi:hypothetical protein
MRTVTTRTLAVELDTRISRVTSQSGGLGSAIVVQERPGRGEANIAEGRRRSAMLFRA